MNRPTKRRMISQVTSARDAPRELAPACGRAGPDPGAGPGGGRRGVPSPRPGRRPVLPRPTRTRAARPGCWPAWSTRGAGRARQAPRPANGRSKTSGPTRPRPVVTRGDEPINTNADYWTRLVGIAWDRDVDIVFDNEPVDLDGDGVADARISRRLHAPGRHPRQPRAVRTDSHARRSARSRRQDLGVDRHPRAARGAAPRRPPQRRRSA